jgi:MraZ protein
VEVCGKNELKVDPKGRVFLPRHWLESFNPDTGKTETLTSFWLTPGLEGCLWLLDHPEFRRMQRRLKSMEVGDARLRRAQRYFYESSEQLRLDAQGRILIPRPQLDAAAIKGEVLLLGLSRRIEIWAPDRFAAEKAAAVGDVVKDLESILSGDVGTP